MNKKIRNEYSEHTKSRVEFSYKKLTKSDFSKVNNCLVEIVNADCPISSRHWELITVSKGKLILNGEEKFLSHDLLDNPDSFLEKLPLQNHIDLKSTSSKHCFKLPAIITGMFI